MQILEIVIYSRHGSRQVIPLRPGALNIITGGANKGKSALIYIVSYCMGGDDCLIPEGRIIDAASWFGVLLDCGSERLFVARENPYPQQSTNRCYLERGANLASPTSAPADSNITSQQVEDTLTRILGIADNLHVPPRGQTRRPLSANIRHALFYCFQHQTEIETNKVLFHRQHEDFVTQAIRDTLPYFLGAVREDHLALLDKLRLLKRDLKLLEQRAGENEAIQGTGLSRANALIEEARQVGIITTDADETDFQTARDILKQAEEWTPAQETAAGSLDLISRLQDDIRELDEARRLKKDQADTARAFQRISVGYSSEAAIQAARLESIGLLDDRLSGNSPHCPVCSQSLPQSLPNTSQLQASLEELASSLSEVSREQPHLQEHIAKLDSELARIVNERAAKQSTLDDLFRQEDNSRRIRDTNVQRGKIVGRISLWLQTVPEPKSDNGLAEAISTKTEEIAVLQRLITSDEEEGRLESLLNRVSSRMTELAGLLKLEFNENPIRLDLNQATLVIDRPDRPVRLKSLGSGRNWVGYHLVTYLALQWHFRKANRPVPAFIIFDQPTQAFFPPDRDVEMKGREDALPTDEDREQVRSMFDLLLRCVKELGGTLQILVTDHADLKEEWFQSAIIRRWRTKDEALIPSDWPNALGVVPINPK